MNTFFTANFARRTSSREVNSSALTLQFQQSPAPVCTAQRPFLDPYCHGERPNASFSSSPVTSPLCWSYIMVGILTVGSGRVCPCWWIQTSVSSRARHIVSSHETRFVHHQQHLLLSTRATAFSASAALGAFSFWRSITTTSSSSAVNSGISLFAPGVVVHFASEVQPFLCLALPDCLRQLILRLIERHVNWGYHPVPSGFHVPRCIYTVFYALPPHVFNRGIEFCKLGGWEIHSK